MKNTSKTLFFAAWVAATLATPFSLAMADDFDDISYTLAMYEEDMNRLRNEIESIANAATRQKAQINALWEEASALVSALKYEMSGLSELLDEYAAKGFVTITDFNNWVEAELPGFINDAIDSSSSSGSGDCDCAGKYALSSHTHGMSDITGLSSALGDKLSKSEASSTYLTKADAANTYALKGETGVGGGGGDGCSAECSSNWESLAAFLGYACSPGGTGVCAQVTFDSNTFADYLGTHNVVYAGDALTAGSEAFQAFDGSHAPTFGVSSDWAGDGLAVDETGDVAALEVKVATEATGDLFGIMDGTVTGSAVEGVVAVDSNGHLMKLATGSLPSSIYPPDGTTIEARDDDGVDKLSVKTSGIVDGTTIKTNNRLAYVDKTALVDNSTIATNRYGKLCVTSRALARPWQYYDGAWHNAYVQIANATYGAGTYTVSGAGSWYVNVNLGTKEVSVSQSNTYSTNVRSFLVGVLNAAGEQTSGSYYTPIVIVYE